MSPFDHNDERVAEALRLLQPMIEMAADEAVRRSQVEQITLGNIYRKLEKIMATLDDVLAKVQAEDTDIGSLAALTAGIKKQLDDALAGALTPSQQMRVDAIFNQLNKNSGDIAAAIKANTETPPPGPAAATATTIASSNAHATVGDPITLSAQVVDSSDATKIPVGAVTFTVDGTAIGTGSLDGTGVAVFTIPSPGLPVGDHPVIATYAGNADFASSASEPLTQTVVAPTPAPAPAPAPSPEPAPAPAPSA